MEEFTLLTGLVVDLSRFSPELAQRIFNVYVSLQRRKIQAERDLVPYNEPHYRQKTTHFVFTQRHPELVGSAVVGYQTIQYIDEESPEYAAFASAYVYRCLRRYRYNYENIFLCDDGLLLNVPETQCAVAKEDARCGALSKQARLWVRWDLDWTASSLEELDRQFNALAAE